MIERLTDWLIERRLKQSHIPIIFGQATKNILQYRRVLNTLRENKVMIQTKEDGIYIRLAGNIDKGEISSLEWNKIVSF